MIMEKISFIYPTLIDEGVVANAFYTPNISMQPRNGGKLQTLAITGGFIFKNVGVYFMDVGIYRGEESVIGTVTNAGIIETSFYQIIDKGPQLAIYSMIAENVDLSTSGFYRVVVRAYGSDNGVRNSTPVDERECFFFVSLGESPRD